MLIKNSKESFKTLLMLLNLTTFTIAKQLFCLGPIHIVHVATKWTFNSSKSLKCQIKKRRNYYFLSQPSSQRYCGLAFQHKVLDSNINRNQCY